MERYHIAENTVQETLIIPLYGRKLGSELYPGILDDPYSAAAAGRLEGSWKDISAPYSGSGITGTLATVETADGFAGVIGQHGEEIIPADGTIANAYNLKISNDGKVILTNPERGVWRVYRLDEAE